MSNKNSYKKYIPYESGFSRRYACWANNHNGWAKMKKSNKRLAKRKLEREMQKEAQA